MSLSLVLGSAAAAPEALLPEDLSRIGNEKRNVLMIGADGLRTQFNFHGPGIVKSPVMSTPNIDTLATHSFVARKNYAQMSSSNPSRASVLTGRRPEATRVFDDVSYFRDVSGNFVTLPELFKQHGYFTSSVGKVFSYGNASNANSEDFARSWSEKPWHPVSPYIADDSMPNQGKQPSWKAVPDEQLFAEPLPDTTIAERAVWKLGKFNKMRREADESGRKFNFLLAVGFVRPAFPLVVPASKFAAYPASDMPESTVPPSGSPYAAWAGSSDLVSYTDHASARGSKAPLMPGETLSTSATVNLRRAYYAAVSHVDDCVGKIMFALRKTGFMDRTVTVFWSDHGVHLGENGMWGANSNFDLSLTAPLMISVPGLTSHGTESKEGTYTELTDIFPTVAALAAGLTVPACPPGDEQTREKLCTMGRNLETLLQSPEDTYVTAAFSAAFSQYPRLGDGRKKSNCLQGLQCIMGYSLITTHEQTEYRYTEWVSYGAQANLNLTDGFKPNWHMAFATELYAFNLNATNPSIERNNLANEKRYEEVINALQTKLHSGPQTPGGWGPWVEEEATRTAEDEALKRFAVAKTALASTSYRLAKVAPAPANITDAEFWNSWESEIATKLPSLPPNAKGWH